LALAKDFSDCSPIAVILGDNTTEANIKKEIKSFKEGAWVFLKEVPDPERFGVPVFNDKKEIINIEEKPKNPKSSYAVTGLYVYDNQVFDIIKNIKPSDRGQLEITDVNNAYIKQGKLNWSELKGFWTDAGTYASLFKANDFWARKRGYTEDSV
jgi:glucose-1-phosphate thymidylyltransferase